MKNNIINKIIIGLTALCLISCAVHQPVSSSAAASADTVTFSGKIITDGGRSAGVNISIDKLDLSVTATYNTDTKSGEVGDDKTIWSITLPKNDAKWQIEIKAKLNSTLIYSGTTDVSADGTVSSDCNITVYFNQNLIRGASGSISLPFTDASGKISKVIMKTVSDNPDIPTFIDASADFDSTTHTAILNATILTGQNTKTFDFCDALGNVLYQCREVITVLADCTTDTWFGASSHIQNGEFKITSDLIDHYGTEIVPRTGIVLYENTTDQSNNYITRYWLGNTDSSIFDGSSYAVSFCFDNLGDVYVLKSINETDGKTTIWSNKTKFNSNQEITLDVTLDGITIDRKTNILYGYCSYMYESIGGSYTTSYKLYKFPELLLSGNTDMTICEIMCDADGFYMSAFCIYNEQLYIPYYPSEYVDGWFKLVSISLSNIDENMLIIGEDDIYDLNDMGYMGISDCATVTDIIYQDECIYMLLREQKWTDDILGFHSRGAVIKYDLFSKAVDYTGWADNTALDNEGKYIYLKNGDNYIKTSNDDSGEKVLVKADEIKYTDDSNELVFEIYSPETEYLNEEIIFNSMAFYGPQKFLAIRPNQLIIADDGLAFYTDDNKAYCAKNVNRVVSVELDSFKISEQNEISIAFDSDYSQDYMSIKTNSLDNEEISFYSLSNTDEAISDNVYIGDDSFATSYILNDVGTVLVIPIK